MFLQTISGQCFGNLNAGPARGIGNGFPYGSNLAGAAGFGPNLAGAAGLGPNLAGVAGFGPNLPGKYGPGCAASTGGSFAVTSASPVSPLGVTVLAENLGIEGPLNVGGNLPFLGTVGIEGIMPGAGAGTVSYGCGSGSVGIVSDNAGISGSYGFAGSPIAAGPYSAGSLNPVSVGSYGCAGAVAPANTYGISGPLGGPGLYGLAGSLGSSAGIGNFGLAGSTIGQGFGSGLGYNGFNGLRK